MSQDDLATEVRSLREENATLRRQLTETQTLLALLEDSLDGIWDWSIQTGDDYLSPRWKRMLGYEDHELANHVDSWVRLLHPDDIPKGYAAVQAHFDHGTPYELILRYLRRDGSIAWMLARGKAVRDEQGNWVRMAGTHTDLTALKQAEEALRESRERYHGMFHGAGVPLIEQDITAVCQRMDALRAEKPDALHDSIANAREELKSLMVAAPIVNINPAALHLFEASQLDTAQHSVGALWRLMPDSVFADTMHAIASRREYFQAESEVRTEAGSLRNVSVTLTLATLSHGQLVARLGLIDVTERRRAEQIMRDLATELERQVRARTLELEAANRELEAFTYTVSHDLRAPLRAIDGFSSMLLTACADSLDTRSAKYIERIRKGIQRMSKLIDDLLGLSRVIRSRVSRERVDVSKLAREVIDELREQEPHRAVDVQVQDGMMVDADPGLLRIAMFNLLDNAWKFTRTTQCPTIEIGQRAADGAYYVKDNGTGFDMSHADKLFTPFQRLHHEREFAGVGIGLATVERIIRRHGGRISGESALGTGATFYFSLGEQAS